MRNRISYYYDNDDHKKESRLKNIGFLIDALDSLKSYSSFFELFVEPDRTLEILGKEKLIEKIIEESKEKNETVLEDSTDTEYYREKTPLDLYESAETRIERKILKSEIESESYNYRQRLRGCLLDYSTYKFNDDNQYLRTLTIFE
jgi:hypothetical protein